MKIGILKSSPLYRFYSVFASVDVNVADNLNPFDVDTRKLVDVYHHQLGLCFP